MSIYIYIIFPKIPAKSYRNLKIAGFLDLFFFFQIIDKKF